MSAHILRYRTAILVVIGVFFVGCSGSTRPVVVDYDTTRDHTTYRANSIPVPIEMRDSGYGTQFKKLRMSLWARCEGEACQPDELRLTLSTSGSSELYIGERTLILNADGERLIWEDRRHQRRRRVERVVGMILRVDMDVDTLEQLVNASEVEGRIGTVTLEIEGRPQERLRSFLHEMGYGAEGPV